MEFENARPHPNYKKVVVGITMFIVIVILGVVGYYYFSTKNVARLHEIALKAEYQKEQTDKIVELFAGLGKNTKPLTDTDKKNLQTLYKNTPPLTTSSAEAKDIIDLINKQSNDAYQQWKTDHQ